MPVSHGNVWLVLLLSALYVSAQPLSQLGEPSASAGTPLTSGSPGNPAPAAGAQSNTAQPPGQLGAAAGPGTAADTLSGTGLNQAAQQPADAATADSAAVKPDAAVKLEPVPGAAPTSAAALAPGARDSSWGSSGSSDDVPGQPGGAQAAGQGGANKSATPDQPLPSTQDTPQNNGVIVGAAVGAAVGAGLLIGATALYIYLRRKRHAASCADITTSPFAQQSSRKTGLINKVLGVGRQSALGPIYLSSGRQQQASEQSRQQASHTAVGTTYSGAQNGTVVYTNSKSPSSATIMGPPVANRAQTSSYTGSLDSAHDSGGFGGSAAAVTAAAAAGVCAGDGSVSVSRSSSRCDMAIGFTGDELLSSLNDLNHIVKNKLLPAVDASTLNPDPIAAWLDAGMDQVCLNSSRTATTTSSSKADFTASHTFFEDWRRHKVWDWLQHKHWRHIRSDKRLLHVQAPHDISQTDFARHWLGHIKQNPASHAFTAAVEKSVSSLVRNAVAVAASTGAMSQEAAAAAQPAAEAYYGPVLRQLCTAALKLHLQVQGTTDTTFLFVPGAADCAHVTVPPGGVACKDRPGGSVAFCLCERPGVFSNDEGPGSTEVWAPAEAVRIVPKDMAAAV